METLVPVEATREEAATRRGSEQRPGLGEPRALLLHLIIILARCTAREVEFVLLVPLMRKALVNDGRAIEVANATKQVRGDALGEGLERLRFWGVVVRRNRERILEALVVGLDECGDTGVQSCRYDDRRSVLESSPE